MKRVLEYFESLSWGKRVQKGVMGLNAGQVWSYPLKLEKGVDYLIKAKGCGNVKSMTCSLVDGYGSPTLHRESGRAPSFSFIPDKDGVYPLHVALDSTRNPVPGAIEVTLFRERVRSRLINGAFGLNWSAGGMPGIAR
jgi:hypothetical protein